MSTGARLALCGSGTGCSTPGSAMPPPNTCAWFRGYVGGAGSYAPPAPVQRESTQLLLCNQLR